MLAGLQCNLWLFDNKLTLIMNFGFSISSFGFISPNFFLILAWRFSLFYVFNGTIFLLILGSYQSCIESILLTLIRESWKKIQNAGPSPSAFRGKKSRAQRCIICQCSCGLEFFSGKRARWRSQKMAYIFVQRGISPIIRKPNWHCICTVYI